MEQKPEEKTAALNALLKKGYSLCFLLDKLVQDYMTDTWFLDFYEETLRKYPDPIDTTGSYLQQATPEERPRTKCRILHLT